MTPVHAGNTAHLDVAGRCCWHHEHGGVFLYCTDRAIPGGTECAAHLIARVAAVPERKQR